MAVSLMIIEVLLFAAARDLTGRDVVKVEVASPVQHADANSVSETQAGDVGNATCVTVSCLLRALGQQYPELRLLLPSCRLAVDCEYVGPEVGVAQDAEVALIPPVSGG